MHQISTILSKVIQELEPNPCFRQFHSLENSISPLIIQEASCLRQWLKPSITTYVQLAPPTPPPPSPPPDTLLCSYVWLHWAGYPYTGRFGVVVYLQPVEYMPPFCIYTLCSGFNKQQRNCNQGPYTVFHSSMFRNGFKTQVVWIVVWILKSGCHLSPKWPISHCSQWVPHLLGVCVSSGKK